MEEFQERFEKRGIPCVITDAISHWPAMKKWSKEDMIKKYGERKFTTDENEHKKIKLKMKLKDYFQYSFYQNDEDPIYLFDPEFATAAPELLDDYDIPIYFREDFFDKLSVFQRPYHR